jgi:phage gp36-like protein
VYTTVEEVRSVLARDTTTTAGTAASLPDAALLTAVQSAEAEVDARLAVRYTVPFTAPPELVAAATRDIAAYLADLVYRQGVDYETDRDPIWLRYQRADKLITDIAAGTITIGGHAPHTETAVMRGHDPYVGSMFGLDSFDLGYDHGRVRVEDGRWAR